MYQKNLLITLHASSIMLFFLTGNTKTMTLHDQLSTPNVKTVVLDVLKINGKDFLLQLSPSDSQYRDADTKQTEREQGFQGCKNKKICGNNGFYAARHSPEGLCTECTFHRFPERFIACLFCRQPIQKIDNTMRSSSCSECEMAFQTVFTEQLTSGNNRCKKEELKKELLLYLLTLKRTTSRKSMSAFIRYDGRKVIEYAYRSDNNILLYRGAQKLRNGNLRHIWSTQLIMSKEDQKCIACSTEEQIVRYIFQKYDIIGPETGKPMKGKMPKYVIQYDELIGRSNQKTNH